MLYLYALIYFAIGLVVTGLFSTVDGEITFGWVVLILAIWPLILALLAVVSVGVLFIRFGQFIGNFPSEKFDDRERKEVSDERDTF